MVIDQPRWRCPSLYGTTYHSKSVLQDHHVKILPILVNQLIWYWAVYHWIAGWFTILYVLYVCCTALYNGRCHHLLSSVVFLLHPSSGRGFCNPRYPKYLSSASSSPLLITSPNRFNTVNLTCLNMQWLMSGWLAGTWGCPSEYGGIRLPAVMISLADLSSL